MRPWRPAVADRVDRLARRIRGPSSPPAAAVPDLDGLPALTDADVRLGLREWSVRHDILRARFDVTPRRDGRPTHAIAYFSCGGVEVALDPDGSDQRFDLTVPAEHSAPTIPLGLRLPDGRVVVDHNPGDRVLADDPSGALFTSFLDRLSDLPAGRVLEVGSRARSGTTYRQMLPPAFGYVGVDIKAGPNVDVVGDAHDLEAAVPGERFDAALSIAVFEHLAMPWKAAVSLNRVLHTGALVFISSHQSFPVHEAPWDFWRYSDRAWRCIFNEPSGFEVVDAAMGEPAELVARASRPSVWRIEEQPAFFTSSVVVRKIGESTVEWPVALDELRLGDYPT